jgi:hypothetical protein
MALPRSYYVDTRVFKSGKSNRFLNVASTYQLNDLISQIVLNTAPGMNQLPLLFNNAITDTYVNGQGTYIQWGGSLVQNTVVDGTATYGVTFEDLAGLIVNSTAGGITLQTTGVSNNIEIESNQVMTLSAVNSIEVQTPLYASTPTGSILRKSNTSGAVEYTPYRMPGTVGTANYILQTDGVGTASWVDASTLTSGDNLYTIDDTFTGNRTASGGGLYNLRFTNLTSYTVSNVANQIELSTSGIMLINQPELRLRGLTNEGTVGRVLQYVNASSDESYWTPYSIPTTDGNDGDILITDGAGAVTFNAQRESVVMQFTDCGTELSTLAGSSGSQLWFGTGSQLTGWELESVTLKSCSTGGAPVALSFQVRLDNGVTSLLSSTYTGTAPQTFNISTAHTISALSDINFRTFSGGGSGTDIFGLTVTFTFKSS